MMSQRRFDRETQRRQTVQALEYMELQHVAASEILSGRNASAPLSSPLSFQESTSLQQTENSFFFNIGEDTVRTFLA